MPCASRTRPLVYAATGTGGYRPELLVAHDSRLLRSIPTATWVSIAVPIATTTTARPDFAIEGVAGAGSADAPPQLRRGDQGRGRVGIGALISSSVVVHPPWRADGISRSATSLADRQRTPTASRTRSGQGRSGHVIPGQLWLPRASVAGGDRSPASPLSSGVMGAGPIAGRHLVSRAGTSPRHAASGRRPRGLLTSRRRGRTPPPPSSASAWPARAGPGAPRTRASA